MTNTRNAYIIHLDTRNKCIHYCNHTNETFPCFVGLRGRKGKIMELTNEEKELIEFSLELSVRSINKVPARVLKRKNANKVLLTTKLNQLLVKFKENKNVL